MTMISLTIPGRPVPLQRSRTRAGRHYLPRRSREYRALIQTEWMATGRPTLGEQPFVLSAMFFGASPRADLDNLIKGVLDALGELAFADDKQLVCISGAHKLPADALGPRAEVSLWAARRGGER